MPEWAGHAGDVATVLLCVAAFFYARRKGRNNRAAAISAATAAGYAEGHAAATALAHSSSHVALHLGPGVGDYTADRAALDYDHSTSDDLSPAELRIVRAVRDSLELERGGVGGVQFGVQRGPGTNGSVPSPVAARVLRSGDVRPSDVPGREVTDL